MPALRSSARYRFATPTSGEPGSTVRTSSSWRRASFTWPDQSSSRPRWKRTVADFGKSRESGPRRENAWAGRALSNSPTAAATRASGSFGAAPCGRRVDALGRPLLPEPLQRDAVEEPIGDRARAGPALEQRQLGRRGELADGRRAPSSVGTKIGQIAREVRVEQVAGGDRVRRVRLE